MTWLDFVPVLLAAIAILYLPGLAVSAAMGARGLTLFVLAPAVTIALVGVTAVAADLLSVPWSPIPVFVASAAVAVVVAGVRRRFGPVGARRASHRRSTFPWPAVAIASGSILVAAQLVLVLGRPDAVSQTWDGPFHYNVLQYIANTRSASSFTVTSLILPPGATSFYPAAWHGVASLVGLLVDAPIPAVANAVNLVIGTVVWVSGAVLLVRTILPWRPSAIVPAGVLAAAFPAFPLLLLDYGVLYPYFLSLAILPAALAVTISFLGLAGRIELAGRWHVPALAAVLVGCVLAQPAAAFAWAALSVPPVIAWYVRFVRRRPRMPAAIWVGVGVAGAVALVMGAWYVGGLSTSAPWGPHASLLRGMYEVATYSPMRRPAAVLVGALVAIGLLDLLIRRRMLWLVGCWAIPAALYIVAAVSTSQRLRQVFTGLFYSDSPRLAALTILVSVPVAAVGVAVVARLARRVIRSALPANRVGWTRPVLRVTAAIALVLLVVGTQGAAIRYEVRQAATKYEFGSGDWMLSADEYELIERLPEVLDDSGVIAGSAWTGTSLAFALADREVLAPHFNASGDPMKQTINMRLNQALTDPTVCPAVRNLDVEYVLDFGRFAGDAGHGTQFDGLVDYPGLAGLPESGVVTLLDQQGEAKLYRVTAC